MRQPLATGVSSRLSEVWVGARTAGGLALLKSAHPDWTPAQLIAGLRAQADDQACGATTAGAECVGPVEDNSYFGGVSSTPSRP